MINQFCANRIVDRIPNLIINVFVRSHDVIPALRLPPDCTPTCPGTTQRLGRAYCVAQYDAAFFGKQYHMHMVRHYAQREHAVSLVWQRFQPRIKRNFCQSLIGEIGFRPAVQAVMAYCTFVSAYE